jgi:hypothetical protein
MLKFSTYIQGCSFKTFRVLKEPQSLTIEKYQDRISNPFAGRESRFAGKKTTFFGQDELMRYAKKDLQ